MTGPRSRAQHTPLAEASARNLQRKEQPRMVVHATPGMPNTG